MSPRAAPLPSASELRPDDASIARFRADLEAITGAAPCAERRLGLAVSGGADSLAMLLLAAAAWPGAVSAATVDHGLRPEAADEARTVGAICARLGVAHRTLAVAGLDGATNIQERARTARYTALRRWAEEQALPWIAVAHQRDDLAETFLMRARRGAGLGGLAAMRRLRPLGDKVELVRPLLDWARCELAMLVRDSGIAAAEDPSNADPRFDRSRMRALIAGTSELLAQRLARAATNLRDAEDAIAWAVGREQAERLRVEEREAWLDARELPYELRRRLAHIAVTRVRRADGQDAPWRDQGLDRLIAALDSGGTGTIAGVQARVRSGTWHFRLAPPRRSH